jgi:hypothetical protein
VISDVSAAPDTESRKAGHGGVDWINLTQHRDQLRDFVTKVTYIPFSSKVWNLYK